MTTTQVPTNGHRFSPPPFPVEHPAAPTGADLPSDKANTIQDQLATDDQVAERQKGVPITPLLAHEKVAPEQPPFAASAYHVPPKLFAPKADSFRNTIPEGWGRTKLPDRCQFMFSDGRQCTMARSDIHPSLCVYHSDREEQLFGDPGQRCEAKTLDFPELHSACRDLSTAAGVNRALAQVFRMLARGRISRQEAATFAKLAQLLLQTISAMRAEANAPLQEPPSQEPALRAASFGREDHEGGSENPIVSEACPTEHGGRHESNHESNYGQSAISGSSGAESGGAQNNRKHAHPRQNEHLRSTAFEPPHNQHLRNCKTSSSSESTLAEIREGSDSIARR